MTAERPKLTDAVEAASRAAQAQFEETLPSTRRALLSVEPAAQTARWALPLGAVVAVALGLFGWALLRPAPLTFEVDARPGEQGAFIAAAATPRSVRFSEGTVVALAPASRVEVVEVDARGSTLRLDTGALDAKVTHREGTRWLVEAGPYRVRVTGTAFRLVWEPGARDFVVTLTEGSVEVTGPLVGTRRVRAGERLEVKAEQELRLEPLAAPKPTVEVADAGESDPGAASASGTLRPRAERRWLDFARARDWEAAWSRLPQGVSPWLQRSSAEELLLLADAARFTGHPREAVEALLALRRRFPRTASSQEAGYLLGRVRADQLGDADGALGAFLAAYDEAPSGALAEESLARALELAVAQRRPEAQALAARYLAAFPVGPHAAQARRAGGTRAP